MLFCAMFMRISVRFCSIHTPLIIPPLYPPFSSEKTLIFLSTQVLGGYLLSNKGMNTPLNWTSIPLKGKGSKVLESAMG